MAIIDKTFLDLPGLQRYDAKIKQSMVKADEKTITLDTTNNELKIKNPPRVEGEVLIL